ncbi:MULTISPECIES: hypothetical protein [Protofrankia]|uniref:Threonine/homoserine efflux transporter RhtA n=1 Tax=Protofrankia coriariae TaxID=1562887 RepID=A0ABR5F3V5_9ACTN|nr:MULTISPECIES: hypothetical protein [Protofrankia]KLL11406.1 hypothetical protein FrCorBMG51_11670 [Protofrankia coriariae]ONH34321.1 hypothetical protein BL254_16605 [Protofrankia sp. BMG5.30]
MNNALAVGAPIAVVSAAFYGMAPMIQAVAARQAPPGGGLGLGLLLRLTVRPLWLLGLAVEAGSFLLEVLALSVAPVALVAPLMAGDMVVFALLARRFLGERISRAGWRGMASMVAGIALLTFAFSRGAEVGDRASNHDMGLFLACGLTFTAVGAWLANRAGRGERIAQAALLFGLSAGACYAIATLATRQIGLYLDDHELARLLATPTPYVLILFSVLALGLEQRGLQGQAAVIAFPVTSGVSAFLPVMLGLTLFGESAPEGPRMVAFVASLLLVAVGIFGLGRDRVATSAPEPESRPESLSERSQR